MTIFSAAKLFFVYGLGNAMTFPLWPDATTILLDVRPTAKNTLETSRPHFGRFCNSEHPSCHRVVLFEDGDGGCRRLQSMIPCTENATGMVHSPAKFDAWVLETADRFGGVTVVGLALQGLWFDPDLPREANPIEDHSNWYKIGVAPEHVDVLREYVCETARRFGQKCLYFERAGEAEFVWDPAYAPTVVG